MDGKDRPDGVYMLSATSWYTRTNDRPPYHRLRTPLRTPFHDPAVPLAPPGASEVGENQHADDRNIRTIFGEVEEGF